MLDNATIWTTKAPVLEFDTIEFSHSSIETIRIVANTFKGQTFGDAVTRLWHQVSDSGRLKPFSTHLEIESK